MLVLERIQPQGVSVIPLPEGGGVVHNLSKIAARFVDLFIQLNGV